MGRRPHHQIVEDTATSPECNPILHVLASFPRTRLRADVGLEVKLLPQRVAEHKRQVEGWDIHVTTTECGIVTPPRTNCRHDQATDNS